MPVVDHHTPPPTPIKILAISMVVCLAYADANHRNKHHYALTFLDHADREGQNYYIERGPWSADKTSSIPNDDDVSKLAEKLLGPRSSIPPSGESSETFGKFGYHFKPS